MSPPITGNCAAEACSDGALVKTVDDTDVPPNDDCNVGSCMNGVPKTTPKGDGTSCSELGSSGACRAGSCVIPCSAAMPCGPCQHCIVALGRCAADDSASAGECKECNDGAATPAAAGTACTTGGTRCDGAGHCVACLADADCPPPAMPMPCTVVTCNPSMHDCRTTAAPAGTPPGTPDLPGDCKHPGCVSGKPGDVGDNGDTDDLNQCTQDACGPESHTKLDKTSCGANGEVCALGVCTGCAVPSDCPSGLCAEATCIAGICGLSNVPAGDVAAASQTPGDCVRATCDGKGGLVLVADDSDLPGAPCMTCSNGRVAVDEGAPCAQPGLFCHAKMTGFMCVPCAIDANCPTTEPCHPLRCGAMNSCEAADLPAGTLVPKSGQTPGDCKARVCDGHGGEVEIPSGLDLPDDGNPCTSDNCTAAGPVFKPLPPGAPCPIGKCDGTGNCRP